MPAVCTRAAFLLFFTILLLITTLVLGRQVRRNAHSRFGVSSHISAVGEHQLRDDHHDPAGRKGGDAVGLHDQWERKKAKQQQQQQQGKGTDIMVQIAGSRLPDCSHACGSCSPCRLVMVSFVCASLQEAETCPMAYKCMCNSKSYPVP